MFRIFSHRAAALAFPLTLAICLPPMAVIAFNLHAQSTSASSPSQSAGSSSGTSNSGAANSSAANSAAKSSSASSAVAKEAAAKEAARKKAFEADLKRLEAGGSFQQNDNTSGPQTLFVSPVVVNMVAGQRADFGAFDNHGRDVSSQAEWTLSNDYVATLVTGHGRPYIVAKQPGEVTVRARIDENESSADITVYDGKTLPAGTPQWIAAKIPGFKAQRVVPAAPGGARPSPAPQAPAH